MIQFAGGPSNTAAAHQPQVRWPQQGLTVIPKGDISPGGLQSTPIQRNEAAADREAAEFAAAQKRAYEAQKAQWKRDAAARTGGAPSLAQFMMNAGPAGPLPPHLSRPRGFIIESPQGSPGPSRESSPQGRGSRSRSSSPNKRGPA